MTRKPSAAQRAAEILSMSVAFASHEIAKDLLREDRERRAMERVIETEASSHHKICRCGICGIARRLAKRKEKP